MRGILTALSENYEIAYFRSVKNLLQHPLKGRLNTATSPQNFWITFLENGLTEQLKKSAVANAIAIPLPAGFSCFVLLLDQTWPNHFIYILLTRNKTKFDKRFFASLSFNSYRTHFPSFWIFPMACKLLEIVAYSINPLYKACFGLSYTSPALFFSQQLIYWFLNF